MLYKTKDINLTNTLMVLGYKLQDTEKDYGRKVIFSFIDTTDLQKDIKKYFDKELLLEPNEIYSNLKTLKCRIYN
jgi:hypothetical protein